ncbi:MAG: LysM peptidoglycan-binding domain-containing protein [Candidatus Roseilinea sp.]|uniref:LysM peptidoglycan-binding domain-containing protein n=1 Tax=Candidatus Roseilinea sp. TaxID=2838777 RepID=UPI00404B9615
MENMRRPEAQAVLSIALLAGAGVLVVVFALSRVGPTTPVTSPATTTGVAPIALGPQTPAASSPAPAEQPAAPAASINAGAPASAPTQTPQPTPLAIAARHTVTKGDTLWGIAVKYGLPLDALAAANPAIDPDRIRPGDTINIPVGGRPPSAAPKATAAPDARVSPTGGNLRLRQTPSTSGRILTRLAANTPLTIVARSINNTWLQVKTPDGTQGWVMAQYVIVNIDLSQVRVAR